LVTFQFSPVQPPIYVTLSALSYHLAFQATLIFLKALKAWSQLPIQTTAYS